MVSDDAKPIGLQKDARLETMDAELAEGMPKDFKIYHLLSQNRAARDAEVLYSISGSPALTLRQNVLVWDPGEYNENVACHQQPVPPISEIVGSPYSYALVARAMRRLLRSKGRLAPVSEELRFPVTVGAWWHSDGSLRVLLCDTEEGFDHSAEISRRLALHWPDHFPRSIFDARSGEILDSRKTTIGLSLNRSADRLLVACIS